MQKSLLQLPGAQPQDYTDQVADVLALLAGTYRSAEGEEAHVVPGEGAALQLWILGSSGGESAEVAGANALRFAANYHVSPATVLEAVAGYRAAFRPSADLDRPYVSVSADVVVADDEAAARELAAGFGPWVRSIRTAEGAIQFPTPAEARARTWTDADRARGGGREPQGGEDGGKASEHGRRLGRPGGGVTGDLQARSDARTRPAVRGRRGGRGRCGRSRQVQADDAGDVAGGGGRGVLGADQQGVWPGPA